MAVGRVGGTKSKIRGQVGDIIYQVKRNDDGSYTQYTYLKGERTEEVLTPRLQAQRMCMAIVESMMRDLKPVARISFQWAKTKTASLNAFSSNNLRLVQRDCQEHWYGDNVFLFPYRHRTDMQIRDEGGPFMLASGSLSYNLYDVLVDDVDQDYQMQGIDPWTHHFLGLVFNCNVGTDTLDDLLQAHKMTLLDTVCFCVYREYFDYVTDPDDPQVYYKHEYVIASLNQNIPGSTVLTADVLRSLFVIDTKWQADVFIRMDEKGFGIGHSMDDIGSEEKCYYMGAFSISHYSGKRLISTSFYTTDDGSDQPWLENQYPAYNFGSWMGEPSVRPYPSPFGPAPVPPTPPRLPSEYQEVEWIQRDSGNRTVFYDLYQPRFASLRFRAAGSLIQNRYILYDNTGSWRPLILCRSDGAGFGVVFGMYGADGVSDSKRIALSSSVFDGIFEFKRSDDVFIGSYNDESVILSVDVSGDSNPKKHLSFWYPDNSPMVYKVYEVTCHDVRDNSLLFDLVPCYRKADGFCGFYNLVSGHFTTGQTKAGQYSHGDPINS